MTGDPYLPPEPVAAGPAVPGPDPEAAGPTGAAAPADPAGPPAGEPDTFPRTGHPAVDAVLGELARVEHADPAAQLPAYQAVHRTLRETLASIDQT